MYWQQPASSTTQPRQGAAAYGGILFQFHNAHPVVDVIDLPNKRKLQEIALTAVSNHHCNNANFGTTRYAASDPFPLLYVSQEQGQAILAYRVTVDSGIYGLTLVQTLALPTSASMGLYYPNCIIDGQGDYLWLSGYSVYSWQSADNGNILRYIKLPLPSLSQGNVTLSLANTLQEFHLPFTYATQGAIYHQGKIYQAYGINNNTNLIRIINPLTGEVEQELHPCLRGMDEEPEGCFIYDGKPMITTITGKLYFVSEFE